MSEPYLIKVVEERAWNPDYPQAAKCDERGCGHPYERHFDSYDDMDPAPGCKYCQCLTFKEST